ncbi:MAG: hypothetical protein IPK07_29075 [Deltaproteobacteria bacterium]|nr:hypothetical protein [Deltaproteobacteria bacterium]
MVIAFDTVIYRATLETLLTAGRALALAAWRSTRPRTWWAWRFSMGRSGLADEWQLWRPDNLLRGVADGVLIERLAERGLPESRRARGGRGAGPPVRARRRSPRGCGVATLLGMQVELIELLPRRGIPRGSRSRARRSSWPSTTRRNAR